jgi:multidrug resistance efflux pump
MPSVMFVIVLAAAVHVWKDRVSPPSLVGEVEAIRANVTVVAPSVLTDLRVDLFQRVQKEEVIGSVLVADDLETAKAELAAIEADLKVTRARMQQDRDRNLLDYEQLRLDWYSQRRDLMSAQVNLIQASNDYNRAALLLATNFVSQEEYELKKTQRDLWQIEVRELSSSVAELDKQLEQLRPGATGDANDPIQEALEAQERQLQLLSQPMPLKAPMAGTISLIYRRPGETVMPGEPILTISSLAGSRIVAFLRQPLNIDPKPGMKVEVRSRSARGQAGLGEIQNVGSQMEAISPTLLPNPGQLENGLPISVTMPPELRLLPGESVSLTLRPKL